MTLLFAILLSNPKYNVFIRYILNISILKYDYLFRFLII